MCARLFVSASVIVLVGGVLHGAVSVDSHRGAQVFEAHSCIRCHSINGKGGTMAPDLGRRIAREYTPASFAALLWNHAPAMWSSMGQQGVEPKPLSQQDAGDLFGYFYSIRFFDKAADAARGKRLFTSNHCSECHSISESTGGVAKPVVNWQSLGHPIELASAMWRHSTDMRQAFAAKNIAWPTLSGQDLADILLYVRNLPATRGKPMDFAVTGDNGKALFDSKGCVKCHTGKLDLAPRLKGKTLNDIAAAMWNHSREMGTPPPSLDAADMSQIVTYLWTEQVLGSSGRPAAGKKIFASNHCASCHDDAASGAPKLAGRKGSFSAVSMVSSLWQHGPKMLNRMKEKDLEWPRFTSAQMNDLIAYLNSAE